MSTPERNTEREVRRRIEQLTAEWGLSPRQAEVLALLARGAPNREIAECIGTTEKTVEAHVTQILRRSSKASRALLIAVFWTGR